MSKLCKKIIGKTKNIELLVDQTHSILKSSQISIVTSGTATLKPILKHPKLYVTKQIVSLIYLQNYF